jgi:hypothetical protein
LTAPATTKVRMTPITIGARGIILLLIRQLKKCSYLIAALIVILFIFCAVPKDPLTNPDNVSVSIELKTASMLPYVAINDTVRLTATVRLAALADSLRIDFGEGLGDTLLKHPLPDLVKVIHTYTTIGTLTCRATIYPDGAKPVETHQSIITGRKPTIAGDKRITVSGTPYHDSVLVLSISAEGSDTMHWAWYKNGVALSAPITDTYHLYQVSNTDVGTYLVRLSNLWGSDSSQPYLLRFGAAIELLPPVNVTSSSMELSWKEFADSAAFGSYRVYFGKDTSITTLNALATVITNRHSTGFRLQNLDAATRYFVRLFVYDSASFVAQSNLVDTVTKPLTSATTITVGNPFLENDSGAVAPNALWVSGKTLSDIGIDSVRVRVQSKPVECTGTTDWVFPASALTDALWNVAVITAYDRKGDSTTKTLYLFKKPTLATAPDLHTRETRAFGCTLAWPPVAHCNAYTVERSGGAGPKSVVITKDTVFNDTGLSSGASYFYRVRGSYAIPAPMAITDTTPYSKTDTVTTVTVFQKAIGGIDNERGSSVVVAGDSVYTFAGSKATLASGPVKWFAAQLNGSGKLLDSTSMQPFFNQTIEAAIGTTGNGLVLTGSLACFGISSGGYWCRTLSCPLCDSKGAFIASSDNALGTPWMATYTNDKWGAVELHSVIKAADGGYVAAGIQGTPLFNEYASEPKIFLAKVSSAGDTLWAKKVGTNKFSAYGAYAIDRASDGGFVIAGIHHDMLPGSFQLPSTVYYAHVNDTGGIIWEKDFNDQNYSIAYAVKPLSAGGYILAGETSYGGDTNMYVVRIGQTGDKIWEKSIGSITGRESARAVAETKDNGFIVVGECRSAQSANDVYLVKLQSDGSVAWSKKYGGTGDDRAASLAVLKDNGILLVGETGSFGSGNNDMYVIKTDSYGSTGPNPSQGN